MKNLLLILLLSFITVFSSCSKGDEAKPEKTLRIAMSLTQVPEYGREYGWTFNSENSSFIYRHPSPRNNETYEMFADFGGGLTQEFHVGDTVQYTLRKPQTYPYDPLAIMYISEIVTTVDGVEKYVIVDTIREPIDALPYLKDNGEQYLDSNGNPAFISVGIQGIKYKAVVQSDLTLKVIKTK